MSVPNYRAAPGRFCVSALRPSLLLLLGLMTGVIAWADGEQRWGAAFVTGASSQRPMIESSPAADADGIVYLSVEYGTTPTLGAVMALACTNDNGPQIRWTTSMPDVVSATPLLAPNNILYVGCYDGVFYGIDRSNGRRTYSYDTKPDFTWTPAISASASLAPDGSTVYFALTSWNLDFKTTSGAVYAMTPDLTVKWMHRFNAGVESSPAVAADGTIYVGSLDHNLYALNPGDGSEKWHVGLDTEIWASPAIGGDGRIYVGSLGNQFVAVTPDGKVKWQYAMTTPGSAAIGPDGTVYIANSADANLYALQYTDANGVVVRWKRPGPSQIQSAAPTVRADGTVLFCGTDKVLRAYNAVDGTQKWSFTTHDIIYGSPAIAPTPDHDIYVGTFGGELYSFRGNESPLSPYSSWPTFQHDMDRSGRGGSVGTGGQLVNLSTRGPAGPGRDLIAGVIIQGTPGSSTTKPLLIRGIGPALAQFGVGDPLPDPTLSVYSTSGASQGANVLVDKNDNWGNYADPAALVNTAASVGAFPLATGSNDSAVRIVGDSNYGYSAAVQSANSGSGVALVEVYDANVADVSTRLINLSTRGFVGTGDNMLIPGLVVGGNGKIRVLVRAIGPGLAKFGVSNTLARPTLAVYDMNQNLIGSNTGWTSGGVQGDVAAITALAGAFPLDAASTDSALVVTLAAPGGYTIQVSGVGGTTGAALVEVYALPF